MQIVDEDRGWRHPALAAPAVLGLLAVVALAVGRHSWSESSSGSRHLPTGFWDWIASGLFVLWISASALAFRQYLRLRRRGGGGPVGPVSWKRAAIVFGMVLLAVLLLSHTRHNQPQGQAAGAGDRAQGLPRAGRPPTAKKTEPGAHFRWEAAAGTLLVLALVGGAWYLVRREPPRSKTLRREAAAALVQLLDDTLDDVRREPDPRKAVIAAYARMEQSLGASGLPRVPSEAPEEYLERVLVELDASRASARRLTDLFARAKFSPHTIDHRMKDEAIDALVALRAELAEPSE